ncbi:hypothetical protein K435DRAFT_847598 [Dendrothele bispora CBS 962.96]|uniref:Uncharacterized protein n=1 Tax=Dendrothele bispora (strain CBS 962.96) TaxID=1314807 RepID=A0A4S8MWQ5_DENBC|nr:hypothetical protein K435DRAFT_847598 [Dendrothele bispora CBS 962.96]
MYLSVKVGGKSVWCKLDLLGLAFPLSSMSSALDLKNSAYVQHQRSIYVLIARQDQFDIPSDRGNRRRQKNSSLLLVPFRASSQHFLLKFPDHRIYLHISPRVRITGIEFIIHSDCPHDDHVRSNSGAQISWF